MSDLIDPWSSASQAASSELIDPWDQAVAQQRASVLPTAALPSAQQPTPQPAAPYVATPPAPTQITHTASSTSTPVTPVTPMSTYLVLAGVFGVLGYAAWKLHQMGKPRGDVGGLDALDEHGVNYALPISEKSYLVVEEIKRDRSKSRVRFPESGAEVWIEAKDLLFEAQAKEQGLQEKTA